MSSIPPLLQNNVKEDIKLIKEGEYISKVDKYFEYFYSRKSTLLDYITEKYIFLLEEPKKILARGKNILNDIENLENALIEKERIIPNALKNYINVEELNDKILYKQKVYLISDDLVENLSAEILLQTFSKSSSSKNSCNGLIFIFSIISIERCV